MTLVLSVDVETSGPRVLKHGIIAIGWCVGNEKGEVLEKKRLNVRLDPTAIYDDKCLRFWKNRKTVWDTLKTDPLTAEEAIKIFIERVYEWETIAPVRIVSDNPAFDFYFINFYLDKYLDTYPISYQKNGNFRPVFDSRVPTIFQADHRQILKTQYPLVHHDHYPDNDAEYIYHLFHLNNT